jgi:hypothetical protein
MCLVSIVLMVDAAWDAWLHPITAGTKGSDRDVTWLEQTSWFIVPSVFLGGIVGMAAGIVGVAFRPYRKPATDRSSG